MGSTLLSYHGPATHRDARDDEILKAWQPKSAKLFNADWGSTDRLTWLYGNLPATTFVYRNWPQSEEFDDMFTNPVATGKRHADEWATRVHNGRDGSSAWRNLPGFKVENQVFCGINEPTLYGQRFEANIAQVAAYYVAFLDTLRAHGLRGGALCLGVGWPNNAGTNTRVRWEPFESVRAAIVRGNHYLILHEYWDIAGPQQNLGWWFGRYKQCPWDVPIIFGELGVDRGVQGPTWQGTRGYSGHMSAEAYIAQLKWADQYMRADRRVHSATVFTWDYGSNEWHSFALREIREPFLQYVISQRNTADPAPTPFPLYPPNVIDPLPPTGGTQVIDLWSNHYSSRAGQAPKYVILHSTASPVGSTLESTAAYLKQNDRGVSIHELVGGATVYRMVVDDRAAHHCESPTATLPGGEPNYLNNELTWGIEGFQIGATPVSAAVARLMLERVVLACRRLNIPSARVLSHQQIDPTRRTDPLGIDMVQFRAAVAAALNEVPTPPPPPPVEPQWAKIVWAIEQAARILQAEGMQREHDVVLSDVSYVDAVRERDN
jgi:hypothetical protein